MTVRLTVFVLTCLCGGGVNAKDALLESPWQLLEGPNFSVATNLPRGGEKLVRELERFRAVVLHYMKLEPVPERLPTRAVVFATQGQFNRITNRPQGLGFTRTTLRNNRLVSSGGKLDVARRHIIFHEYVHFLLRAALRENQPTWYDEGLADMLSTVHERKAQMFIGAPPPSHMQFINSTNTLASAGRVVHSDDLTNWRPLSLSQFYAYSWAIVSHLHADPRGRRQLQLADYLQRLRDGEERENAFQSAFGKSPRRMLKAAVKSARKRRRGFETLPAERFTNDIALSVRPMTQRDAAYELAHLAMFTNPTLARELLQDVLTEFPEDHRLLTGLAVTYQAEQDYAEGIELARRAAREARAGGDVDVIAEIDLADMLMVWNTDACASQAHERKKRNGDGSKRKAVQQDSERICDARYREARAAYERARIIEPSNPEVLSGLAWALGKLGEDEEAALEHIAVALDYQPWAQTLRYRAGVLNHQAGRLREAERHLEKAVYWSKDAEVRENAVERLNVVRAELSEP